MARVRDIIQRDTRANQPVATTVDVGTLYYVTDENITERSNGTTWQTYSDVGSYVIEMFFKAAIITTGLVGFKSVPLTGTITKVRLVSTAGAGSIVIDIWKDTFANFPPTVADTITAAAKPTLSATDNYEDSTLTGWTTAVTAGDVLGFNVDSVTSVVSFTLELTITV